MTPRTSRRVCHLLRGRRQMDTAQGNSEDTYADTRQLTTPGQKWRLPPY